MFASGRGGKDQQKHPGSPLPYKIDLTETAATVYKDLLLKCKEAERLGHPESSHCTKFRMVEEAIKKIIPNDPHSKAHALRGHLSNLFRLKKGRWRIVWIASSEMRRVCILYISETMRKDGDSDDPYEIFLREFDAGEYDEVLEQLGVRTGSGKRK